jgi:hypothetical protein
MASISATPASPKPAAGKPCSGCEKILPKTSYSGSQWKKGAKKMCLSCCEEGAPPAWLKETEQAAQEQYAKDMEWVKRREAEAKAVEDERLARIAAIAKAKAAKVALRQDAVAMFASEGAEHAPFALSLDTRAGNTINQKWRGYKSQGEVQSVAFKEDSTFTVRNWSDDEATGYELVISGWYLCRDDNGVITGRIDDVTYTGVPNTSIVQPNTGDFLEGVHQKALNKLDPNKFAMTFVAARGRTRSRGGSGSGSFTRGRGGSM